MGKVVGLPFKKKIALGQIDGIINIDKFGETLDIDTGGSGREIWDRLHPLTYLTEPTEFYISSSNATDDQIINCILMTAKKRYVPVKVQLNGQTPVAISAEGQSPDPDFCPGCGFYRGVRLKPDNGSTTLGDVYVASNNTNHTLGVPLDAEIQAWFSLLKQQTQMSHFTTPKGYYGLLTDVFISILNEGNVSPTNADVVLHRKHMDGTVFRNKWTLPVNSEGGPLILQGAGKFVKPEYDMHFYVNSVGRNDTKLSCSYTLELYREDKINPPIVLD